jgi:diaminohydroxyphosphoribosylaminopyrimidine deaminase/5-amino-6-(5-phosphoribosylamino)uracil reductase
MVGAVIVCDGKIIGEGYHREYGKAHAEVNAISSVSDPELLKKSTIYVSLEPCSHYGKTPPCAELIIKKRIPRVVVASLDPFPAVSGKGIRMLKDAGVDVKVGVLEKEAIWLNKEFMTLQTKSRPYVYLKWAESADGFIDVLRNSSSEPPVVLSDSANSRRVHKMRAEVSAIMVGTNTAYLDNPSLTTRNWCGKNPTRVLLDRTLRLPSDLKLFDRSVPTIVFTEKERQSEDGLEYVKLDFDKSLIENVLTELGNRKINSLIVEGGAALLNGFIQENVWDEMAVETTSTVLGQGVSTPSPCGVLVSSQRMGGSLVREFINRDTYEAIP